MQFLTEMVSAPWCLPEQNTDSITMAIAHRTLYCPMGMSPSKTKPVVEPPPGMVAERFDVDGDAFVLLEWPLPKSGAASTLTPSEREVLDLVLEGLSNQEIARRRGRSPRTISNQIASLFSRLGVHSRLELFALITPSARQRPRDPPTRRHVRGSGKHE